MAVADVFGEYRVLEVLGHGAMGMVYRAHDPRLDRFVALKLVHPQSIAKDATKARARLVSEARALARVAHPNVLAVYDVGVQDDVVFVALELVEGVDLAQWLRARRRPWPEVVDVFLRAASGLAAVHAAGLVHRDIKPANILVEPAPRGRGLARVLVADFGIARAIDASAAVLSDRADTKDGDEEGSLTEEGRVVGTPAYMAPEQHYGLEVDAAADQYALCVALHEALYGKRPFGTDAEAMLRAKMNPPDAPPPAKVPAWLWKIVRRGISPLAPDRFPAIDDLLAALRAGDPRRKLLVPAAIAGAVLIGGAAIVSSLVRDPPCRDTEAKLAEVWNDGRRESIATAFAASTRPHAVQTWTRVSAQLDDYASELAATYRDACDAAYVRKDQSESIFDRRIACLDHRKQELTQSLALLAVGDADLVDHADDIASSLRAIAPCSDVAALEAGIPLPSPAQADAVTDVRRILADAEALQAAGRYDDAAAAADDALARARSVDYRPAVVEALTLVGEVRERQSRIDEARAALEEGMTMGLEIGYDERVAEAAVMRAWIAAEYERDLVATEKWGALARSQLERIGNPPRSAIALHNALGTAYAEAGRFDDALREYEQALARAGDDPELAEWAGTLHANTGNVQFRSGALARAQASYERALEIFSARFGEDHPNVVNTEFRIAQLLDLSGRHDEAIPRLRRAIASLERTQATPVELAGALIGLGLALRNAGENEESSSTYRRAVELLGPTGDDVSLAHALVSYGHSCVE
ncbi:MAG TPA: tetratricopeptide repeat protein, partial [Nannocystaceae bacterium]|nr:tetratricopeptide repeat protein [Nannocystaceae bacterium]